MTVMDFLLHKTNVGELCIIYDCGYPVQSAYIDSENLFAGHIDKKIAQCKVKSDKFQNITISCSSSEFKTQIHRIDI